MLLCASFDTKIVSLPIFSGFNPISTRLYFNLPATLPPISNSTGNGSEVKGCARIKSHTSAMMLSQQISLGHMGVRYSHSIYSCLGLRGYTTTPVQPIGHHGLAILYNS